MELSGAEIAAFNIPQLEKELRKAEGQVEYLKSEIARFQSICSHPHQIQRAVNFEFCLYCPDCHHTSDI